ncbi:MAG: glycine cleavage system aminomethyltransferase GcvT [Candidatus Omnitrophica bacterium]|nr:glycine cleavage system aminomethyltransferase GcvT [Candidatus Omnitrophota bacterium]
MKNTPLYQEHVRLGALMAPFAGWNMPIQYSGILEEHLHTRTSAGIFDICHMGEFLLKGDTAAQDVDALTTCKISDMLPGRCHYGFMLNDNGRIIDDLIVFKLKENEFMIVVNAGTIDKDKAWIKLHLSKQTHFEDISDKTAKIDLQGPLSGEILSSLTSADLGAIKKYHFTSAKVAGVETLISRTGYTGELGYELYFPSDKAAVLWNILLGNKNIKPIGLGARDTLRLEMGYSLYGHDIDENHTPLEANLEKFIHTDKNFVGKDALIKQKAAGAKKLLVGFMCEGRRSPRQDFDVLCGEETAGKVTSGSFSPCLKKAIGLCYIDTAKAYLGNKIILNSGNINIEAVITKPPFYKKIPRQY